MRTMYTCEAARIHWNLLRISLNWLVSSKTSYDDDSFKENLSLCMYVSCVVTPKHNLGTFQKEGKDFPSTGNVAQDKHPGLKALVPLLKFSVLFQRMFNWSRKRERDSVHVQTSGFATSKINCDGNIFPHSFVHSLLKYKELSLHDPVCKSSHIYRH